MNITMALDIILSLTNKTEETESIRIKLFNEKMKYGGRREVDDDLKKRIEEIKGDK